jgi:hypothetical protein
MSVRSLGNALSSFGYKFGTTGFNAAGASGGGVWVTGGTQTVVGSYRFVEFRRGEPGTFTIDSGTASDCVVLLVGGGASGGAQVGGGGGGGGVIYRNDAVFNPGTYTYTIGDGGASVAIPSPGQPGPKGNNGGDSTVVFGSGNPQGPATYTAKGGGAGGGYGPGSQPANPGGSGGGSGGNPSTAKGNSTQPTQSNPGFTQYGNPGGNAYPGNWGGGGGGGAGGAGSNGPSNNNGGPGGDGVNFPEIPTSFGDNGYFGGGGGGCRNGTNGTAGSGGSGGGGQGSGNEDNPRATVDGQEHTGGGGGGTRDNVPIGSGEGGTGVLIIRVPN